MLGQADLDFGIYRVMNANRAGVRRMRPIRRGSAP